MNSLPRVVRCAGNVLIVVLFVGALCLPMLSSLFGFAPLPRLQEKRRRAEAPDFKLDGAVLAEFPAKFEAYYNDNFPFRDQLVLWHNYAKVCGLQVSPRSNVLLGKKGWLYYQDGLLDHDRPIVPLTDQQLAAWVRVLEERQEWLAERGIHFLIVVAPDKQSVYPEFLPNWVKRVGLSPRLDQFLAYVRKHSDLTLVDLRAPLSQAKADEPVYYTTDTHWNSQGALVGDRCIAEAVGHWYPRVRPLPRSGFSSGRETYCGDLANMLGLPDSKALREEATPLRALQLPHYREVSVPAANAGYVQHICEVDDPALPKAVLLHDSFGNGMLPYLSEHFRRIAYSTLNAEVFNTPLFEQEKPDVVIYEFVERRLAADNPPANTEPIVDTLKNNAVRNKFKVSSDVRLALRYPGTASGIDANVTLTPGPGGLAMAVPDPNAVLVLPAFACTPQESLILCVDLTSPGETVLDVYYQTREAPVYAEARKVSRWLHKGRNVIYLEVKGPNLTGRLRLDPGRVTGQYLLQGIEARGVPLERGE